MFIARTFLSISVITLVTLAPVRIGVAATFHFEPLIDRAKPGEEVTMRLLLSADQESINAIEGRIAVTGGTLLRVETGGSIIEPWIVEPSAAENVSSVSFAGIIPGGFTGVRAPFTDAARPGEVLSLIVRGDEPGTLALRLEEVRALRNDGFGSDAAVTVVPYSFAIAGEAGSRPSILWYAAGFGILVLLLIAGALYALRRRTNRARTDAGTD